MDPGLDPASHRVLEALDVEHRVGGARGRARELGRGYGLDVHSGTEDFSGKAVPRDRVAIAIPTLMAALVQVTLKEDTQQAVAKLLFLLGSFIPISVLLLLRVLPRTYKLGHTLIRTKNIHNALYV